MSSRAPWRSPTTRPASSTSASEQPTCSPTIARSAGAPRPSRTACASRSWTSSARSTRASCAFASCAEIAFVSAMNGTSYGTVISGKPTWSASSASAAGGSAQPKPTPNARPASPCSASRRTYSRCGRESSPIPSPVVISSSPPSSHGVGSGSSETWTQRIGLSLPSEPAVSSSPRPGRSAMSRTVSMESAAPLGRAGQDATPCVTAKSKHSGRIRMLCERGFAPCCRSAVEIRRPGVHCAQPRGRGESRRVSPGALGGRRRPRGAAALRRARRLDSPARGRARRGRAGRGRGRHGLPRLRRWDRVPEHGARVRSGRRGDPRAGRQVPPPVLHGRHVRVLRRGVPPARRALAMRRRRARSRFS